jgi:hypothetical protein
MNFKAYYVGTMLDIIVNLIGVYVYPSLLHFIIFCFVVC